MAASIPHHSDESSITTPTSAGFAAVAINDAGSQSDAIGDATGRASALNRSQTPPLLRAPTGQAFAAHVKMWGPSEIATFLNLYKCDTYISLFHQNDIDGKVLLDLDMSSLKEIGINKVGDRVKLLGGVRDLRKRAARVATPLGTLASRVPNSVEASPLSTLEHDSRASQVQRRLANTNTNGSKRLDQVRPPPLNILSNHSSLDTTTRPAVGESPPPRSDTPKTQYVSAKGAPSYDSALRPPANQARRSPSPAHDQIGRSLHPGSQLRPDAIRSAERRPGPSRYDKSPSPVHPFAVPGTESTKRHATHPSTRMNHTPMEERVIVKFVNAEDGTTKKVLISGCTSGVEILELALKKFGKWHTGSLTSFGSDSDDNDRLELDGWGVFIHPGDEAHGLSDSALLDICNGHRSSKSGQESIALRERGLILRRVSHTTNRKNLETVLGPYASHSPNSPSGITVLPRSDSKVAHKIANRASAVSILSSLNVPGVVDSLPSPSTSRSPSAPSRTKKMYNFFGHRPPSELISNHLAEYFPSARKKDLEKTVRQSMRLSQGDRQVALQYGLGGPSPFSASLESVASPNRKGRPPSTRTVSSSTTPAAIPEEVETPNENAARSSSANALDEASVPVTTHPPLLPPFESSGSLADSLQEYSPAPTARTAVRNGRRGSDGSTLSRMSVISSIRRSKDKSDSASLLTVDEITAEVENRRASMTTVNDSYDHDRPFTPVDSDEDISESEEDEDEDDEDDEGDEDDEDDDEDDYDSDATSDDEEHGQGRAFITSTGSKRNIKWIKGALIGAGSFGSVYLGMDAQSGLLMAVKQVELSSGDARNEEKKRNMVQALEREIELLKELAHTNIVQYLDSASDGNHLNIFLEYVPGGSVAALLNNYGAFEEALVRNFVRQILEGLNYLHQREIIHRDIKGANILVDNKGGIKISDFGISKKAENSMKSHRPSLQGSVFWMAPEVVKQTSYTSKADIWSVGCLVVEMLTGTHPWADLTQMQAIFQIGKNVRPATPSDISAEAADFLNRTFEEHTARPTAAALLEHPFITLDQLPNRASISLEQASATLGAAAAARNQPMPGLSGLGLGLSVKQQ